MGFFKSDVAVGGIRDIAGTLYWKLSESVFAVNGFLET
jgi:hypothetical protein